MADADFFDDTKQETTETPTEPEKVKVGEKEYTKDELNRLVQLGEIGADAEERYNVKLDKVWPNLQQTINDKKALEDQLAAFKAGQAQNQPKEEGEPSPEEIARKAREEAKKLGLISIDDVDDYIDRRIGAVNLKNDVGAVVAEAEEKYGIKTAEETILDHMMETGIRNPQKAFKDLYEDKIDAWKEQQLQNLKKPGMVTEDSSSAGSKQPKNEPVTKDNFFARMDEVMDRQS